MEKQRTSMHQQAYNEVLNLRFLFSIPPSSANRAYNAARSCSSSMRQMNIQLDAL
jgi:hypothetical protein